MSTGQRRFILHAVLVFVVAFVFGLGDLLTEAPQPPRPREASRPPAPRKSGDDAGFSIALTQPTDPFLVGRQTIAVEAEVPGGDRILQVDFFVDGRLVDTDRQAPYAISVDFGNDIKRHTLVATALTGGGRRAKVSFVSRAAGLDGDPDRPMVVIPVVVRDAAGRLVDGLSVSDFTLLENGQRQTVLHFDHAPAPLSVGMVLHAPDAVTPARGPLLRQAALLADDLPPYHALAFLDAPRAAPAGALPAAPGRTAQASLISSPAPARKEIDRALPGLEFTYDRTRFVQSLAESAGIRPASDRRPSLAQALAATVEALATRPRGRVIVALVASTPGPGTCPVLAAETPAQPESPDGPDGTEPAPGAAPTPGPAPGRAPNPGPAPGSDPASEPGPASGPAPAPEPEPLPEPVDPALSDALEALKMAGVTLHVLAVGEGGGPLFDLLRETSAATGGEFLPARSQPGLEAFSRLLAETLTSQYLLAYRPPHPERAGWRTLDLRVRPPDLALSVRGKHYLAPPPEAEPAVRPASARSAAGRPSTRTPAPPAPDDAGAPAGADAGADGSAGGDPEESPAPAPPPDEP